MGSLLISKAISVPRPVASNAAEITRSLGEPGSFSDDDPLTGCENRTAIFVQSLFRRISARWELRPADRSCMGKDRGFWAWAPRSVSKHAP